MKPGANLYRLMDQAAQSHRLILISRQAQQCRARRRRRIGVLSKRPFLLSVPDMRESIKPGWPRPLTLAQRSLTGDLAHRLYQAGPKKTRAILLLQDSKTRPKHYSLSLQRTFTEPTALRKLVGDLAGAYSRRINIQHRFVYEVVQSRAHCQSATHGHTTSSG